MKFVTILVFVNILLTGKSVLSEIYTWGNLILLVLKLLHVVIFVVLLIID